MINNNNYKHYILSRFNIPNNKTYRKPSQKWLEVHYKLFDDYCYPSIINQTDKCVTWLIAFDNETIDKDWVEQHKLITPLYISDFSRLYKHHCKQFIISEIPKWAEYLITTRVDVDDFIHRNFISTIHNNVLGYYSTDICVSLTKGLTYDTETNATRIWKKRYTNPFISLVEKLYNLDNINTVNYTKHCAMDNYFEVLYIDTIEPMWGQTINGYNVSNIMRGKSCKIDMSKYNIKEEK